MARKNKYITKKDIVNRINRTSKLDKDKINKIVELYFDQIKKGILSGEQVRLIGFGSFQIKKWKESVYFDPNTRTKISKQIKTVSFKPSTKIKENIRSK